MVVEIVPDCLVHIYTDKECSLTMIIFIVNYLSLYESVDVTYFTISPLDGVFKPCIKVLRGIPCLGVYRRPFRRNRG